MTVKQVRLLREGSDFELGSMLSSSPRGYECLVELIESRGRPSNLHLENLSGEEQCTNALFI